MVALRFADLVHYMTVILCDVICENLTYGEANSVHEKHEAKTRTYTLLLTVLDKPSKSNLNR